MNIFECAVIGAGHVGKHHAEKYARVPGCHLAAIVDNNIDLARKVADKYDCPALTDYRELFGMVDAVSICVPSNLHFKIARDYLDTGSHLLVEKPLTVNVAEADELIELANRKNQILQVGHIERFNPTMLGAGLLMLQPRFIEAYRISPFTPRNNDINVVLDLMIHDIDIILHLVNSKIEKLDANGTSVINGTPDIANARLTFTNGCVANITASRVSLKTERKMRLFMPSCYISLDFQNNTINKYFLDNNKEESAQPGICSEETVCEYTDALFDEIQHFISCIRSGSKPLVSGETGRDALEVAIAISESIDVQQH